MSGTTVLAHLRNGQASLVIAERNGQPFIAHLGADLGADAIDARILSRGIVGGGLDTEIVPALVAQPSMGWPGRSGIEVRDQRGLPTVTSLTLQSYEVRTDSMSVTMRDSRLSLEVSIDIEMEQSGTFRLSPTVSNRGQETLHIDALRVCLPVGAAAREVLTLGGRHAMEAVQQRTNWERSVVAIENRSGRTSHENLGVVFAGSSGFDDDNGEVWGVHIAWSGNFEIMCDGVSENLRTIHAAELLRAGEITLPPGGTHGAPDVVVVHSGNGLNGVSQKFHQRVRKMHGTKVRRPVILNTWEAVYFNHDLDTLTRLADLGAAVGVERFVLDDGWFHDRRNDTAGLGDWWVDTAVWPDGLTPLITHVTSLGMEFGLWFEPEMVNPDSDLYRAHPDWVLGHQAGDQLLGRHQLVLDLSREDVRNHLFHCVHELLSTHDIAYVKWDHNRPLTDAASAAQTRGVYELFDRLSHAHVNVQFESCASGGGRIDHGIARYTRRFWASDSIDALDRLEIQRGLSLFMPPETLGSHIGAPICHTTGRRHSLPFRAATAMFGWLGIEWNLLDMSDKEIENLTRVIETYKSFRPLLHSGNHFRGSHPDSSIDVHGVIASDRNEALVSVSRLGSGPSNRTAPLRVTGLKEDATYVIRMVDLGRKTFALHRALPDWMNDTPTMTGTQLAHLGLHVPPLRPETAIVLHIEEVAAR